MRERRRATTLVGAFCRSSVLLGLLACLFVQLKAIVLSSSSSSSVSSVSSSSSSFNHHSRRRRRRDEDDFVPRVVGDYHSQREREEGEEQEEEKEQEEERPHIHVLATSNGSPYLNWQTRIMYRTFLDVVVTENKNGGGGDLKYFTRLLHRRTDDELMKEVPTVRVDSLHPSCDKWCEFPVHDRPDAIKKWLQSKDSKRGGAKNKFVLMIETDYVFKKPMRIPSPLLDYHRSFLRQNPQEYEQKPSAIAFHFNYINPHYPTLPPVMERLMSTLKDPRKIVDTKKILASGPAPTLIHLDSLNRLIDDYIVITEEIEKDEDAKKKLGWVREMYAYSIAAATSDVKHIVEEPRQTMLISQPPADDDLYEASMYHYTWGARYVRGRDTKSIVWDWDKRPYIDVKHVREPKKHMPPMPPDSVEEGDNLRLLDGTVVTSKLNNVMKDLIGTMRNAIERLDTLAYNCGWLDTEPKCDFRCRTGELC